MLRNKISAALGSCARMSGVSIHTSTAPLLSDMKMEKSVNQVTLLGRVGADPQRRGTAEHPVVTFSLATHNNYRYAESGDVLQRTDWHRVSVFRPHLRDAVVEYLKRGQRVLVTGRLTYGEIKTEEGALRTTATIVADNVIFFQHNNKSSSGEE